ncbi:hypothetical protein HDV06_003233, partial [Boothiomyces sp. JEL0866]
MPFPTLLPYQKQPRLSSSKSFEKIKIGNSTADQQVLIQDFEVPDNIVADQYRKFTEVKEDQQEHLEKYKLKIGELEVKNKQLSLILHDYDQTIQSQAKEIKVLKAALANQEYGSPAHVKVLVSTIDGLQRELHRLRDQNSILLNEDNRFRNGSYPSHERELSGDRKSVDRLHFQYKSPRASPAKLYIPNSNLNEEGQSRNNSPISRKSNVSPTISPTHNSSSNFSSSFNSPVLLQGKRDLRNKIEKQENFYPSTHLFNQKLQSPGERPTKFPSPKSERLGVFANLGKNIGHPEIGKQELGYSIDRGSTAQNVNGALNRFSSAKNRELASSNENNNQVRQGGASSIYSNGNIGYHVNHSVTNRLSNGIDKSANSERQTLNTLHEQLNYIGLLLDHDEKKIGEMHPRTWSPSLSEQYQPSQSFDTRTIQSSHSVPELNQRKEPGISETRTSILKQASAIKSPRSATVRINPSPIGEKRATSTTSSPSPTKSMLIHERDLLEQELL